MKAGMDSRFAGAAALLLVLCATVVAAPQKGRYVFVADESAVTLSGGFAGVQEEFTLDGSFVLAIDPNGATAAFERVDANLVGDSPFLSDARDLNTLFNMTNLTGTVTDDRAIAFEGLTADGLDSTVLLRLELADGAARLTGRTIPPPDSADFFVLEIDAVATRKYAGGTGEPNTPYLIATAEDLYALGADPNDYDKHFKLSADIDLSGFDGREGRPPFNMIGFATWTDETPFRGVFDGDGFTISNLDLGRQNAVPEGGFLGIGLFGYVEDPNAEIRNVRLVDPNINAPDDDYVGSLVGWLEEGVIDNCTVQGGTVRGSTFVGGLFGQTGSHEWEPRRDVAHCAASVDVIGKDAVGGLGGSLLYGTLTRSSADANVTGELIAGGLLGCNKSGMVTECYSQGRVSGDSDVGGLFGSTGYCFCFCFSSSLTLDCYSTTLVEGTSSVGGLVGYNTWGRLRRCYSAGQVPGGDSSGGLIGSNDVKVMGAVEVSFWDVQASGQATSAGGTGLTTGQMQTAATFLTAGWDFVGETDNGTENVWFIDEGRDYPRLAWERTADDFEDGTPEPLWQMQAADPNTVSLAEANGRLELHATADASGALALYVSDGWTLDPNEDFALRVAFHHDRVTLEDNWLTIRLSPNADVASNRVIEFAVGCEEYEPYFWYEQSLDLWHRTVELAPRSAFDGTLYVSYDAALDELYLSATGYGPAHAWTLGGLLGGQWSGAPLHVAIGGGSDLVPLTSGHAHLDNFVIDRGTTRTDP